MPFLYLSIVLSPFCQSPFWCRRFDFSRCNVCQNTCCFFLLLSCTVHTRTVTTL